MSALPGSVSSNPPLLGPPDLTEEGYSHLLSKKIPHIVSSALYYHSTALILLYITLMKIEAAV